MKPAPFVLERPDTLGAALALRANDDIDSVALAGGQSLLPLMNLRLTTPELVIDLNRVRELDHVGFDDGRLIVGAMTRQSKVEQAAEVRDRLPALARTVALIGHRTIRNRGTIGGSLCHADPAAELPALALALDAELVATSGRGSRVVSAYDFNQGYLTTDLDSTELLTEVRWPLPGRRSVFASSQFLRRAGDFALAGALVLLDRGPSGEIEKARVVAYGGISRPTRLGEVEEALQSSPGQIDPSGLAELCGSLVAPASDLHGAADYKRRLFEVTCRRALTEAVEQFGGGGR